MTKRYLLVIAAFAALCAALVRGNMVVGSNSAAPAAPPLIDDFSGATQNPLSTPYVITLGSVQRTGGAVVHVSGDANFQVSTSSYTFAGNHFSEATPSGASMDSRGLRVRCQPDGSGYLALVVGSPYYVVLIGKWAWNGTGYDFTEINRTGYVFGGGTVGLRATGSSLIFYYGAYGSQTDYFTVSDSTYSGGVPGWRFDGSAGEFTDIKAGNN